VRVLTGGYEDAGRRRQVIAPRRHLEECLDSSGFAGGGPAAGLPASFGCGGLWPPRKGRGAGRENEGRTRAGSRYVGVRFRLPAGRAPARCRCFDSSFVGRELTRQ
jgi:hypothetical protein